MIKKIASEVWAVLFLLAFVACMTLADLVIRLLPGDEPDYYDD